MRNLSHKDSDSLVVELKKFYLSLCMLVNFLCFGCRLMTFFQNRVYMDAEFIKLVIIAVPHTFNYRSMSFSGANKTLTFIGEEK